MRNAVLTLIIVLLICGLGLTRTAQANNSPEVRAAQAVSDVGVLAVLAGAVVMPLFLDQKQGKSEALRTADAVASSTLITLVLKRAVDQPRPNGEGHDSFPSDHATVAFAAATMAADRHPEQAPYWYGAAAVIAYSRVRANQHRPSEVIAGALIGFGMAKLERRMPRGLLIAPFVTSAADGGGVEAVWRF